MCSPLRRFSEAVDAFLVSRTVAGCTSRTVQLYREVLIAFVTGAASHDLRDCSLPVVQTCLTSLRARVNASSWCVESGLLGESPLRVWVLKTLLRVPEYEAVPQGGGWVELSVEYRRVGKKLGSKARVD